MTLDIDTRKILEPHVFTYVTGGDYEKDYKRFSLFSSFIKEKFPGVKKVLSIGCGSAEESMALASKGYEYAGYDISSAYSVRFPIEISEEVNVDSSNLNVWFRREYGRYDDIGEALDTLAHPGMLRDMISVNIGEDFDATKTEFWEKILKTGEINDNLVLFRHPDVKDNYENVETMIKSAIEMKAPIAITTSNTLSLGLILDILNRYLGSSSTDSVMEELKETEKDGLNLGFKGFSERIKDIPEELINKTDISGVDFDDKSSYVEIFENTANVTYTLEDGTKLIIETAYTPDFSRTELGRMLDSWVISVNRS